MKTFLGHWKARLFLVIALVALTWTFVNIVGPLDRTPRLRATATSPDGKLNVRVYVVKLQNLPTLRFGVFVRVYTVEENLVYEKQIFEDGWWNHDLGEMYTSIAFEHDEIRVGPKFDPTDYFVIKMSDLTDKTSVRPS